MSINTTHWQIKKKDDFLAILLGEITIPEPEQFVVTRVNLPCCRRHALFFITPLLPLKSIGRAMAYIQNNDKIKFPR